MTIMRPGGRTLTEKALEMAGLKKGCRILDVGCGHGDTVAFLTQELGIRAEGIDMNLSHIAEAKELHPGIEVTFGDGEFLDSYMSYTFDGILMESSLSLINMPDEAMHEAYCVLKKGGKLVIADLYEKKPDRDQMRAVSIEADRIAHIPHQEGDCEERGIKFVDFRFEGAFYRERLIRQLRETGFQSIQFEDRSTDLEQYLEEKELTDLSPYIKQEAGGKSRDIGYFLLVAEKPL